MAKTVEDHLKLITGDLVVTVARVSAENDALREENAALRAQLAAALTAGPVAIAETP